MMSPLKAMPVRLSLVRLCLAMAVTIAPAIETVAPRLLGNGSASAQTANAEEKDAFEAAKALGTVEAWDAFLSNYATGFHADLARAYVKKLGEAAPNVAVQPANDDFPTPAGSWGGIVRSGPGKQYRKVDSLDEGERITLMGRSDVVEDGYPWFKIMYRGGGTGYKWGGILCSVGAERPDLFKTCPAGTARNAEPEAQPKCKDGGEWDGLRCRPAGFFDEKKTRSKKKCAAGEYLNQNGVCQPNETGQ